MPRYHFDIESKLKLLRNGKESEMLDDEAARKQAGTVLGDIVRIMVTSRLQHEVPSSVRNPIGTVICGVKRSLVNT